MFKNETRIGYYVGHPVAYGYKKYISDRKDNIEFPASVSFEDIELDGYTLSSNETVYNKNTGNEIGAWNCGQFQILKRNLAVEGLTKREAAAICETLITRKRDRVVEFFYD